MHITKYQLLFRQVTIASLNVLGGIGFLIMIYGIAISHNSEWSWPMLDKYATFISALLTLLASLCTTISIYLPAHTRKADFHSKVIVSPIVSMIILIETIILFITGNISEHIVSGIGIMSLAGALFRLLPFSEQPGLEV
ncbi:hypothetical protein [Desulfolutivibrio sulfoxidireducens]|uniref:hypothetical protein n=1 Tax=Desulfolutivibrio sulfoxidireducens TaxID=2773299 RepID=UPI00159E2AFD|nr:hypothetical protein [Desulfolutivibrio sulfoxidireducens]QLA19293.1 hypothetical protein GD604_05790 [Desulfolutivibrio sulfoxidireducens]